LLKQIAIPLLQQGRCEQRRELLDLPWDDLRAKKQTAVPISRRLAATCPNGVGGEVQVAVPRDRRKAATEVGIAALAREVEGRALPVEAWQVTACRSSAEQGAVVLPAASPSLF
jgi:hypothetical protein